MKLLLQIIALLIVLTLASPKNEAEAHGFGQSVEQRVGDYFIDIGFEPTEDLDPPAVFFFDFQLTSAERKAIPFTSVEVTIKRKEKTEFWGAIHTPEFGPPRMIYEFEDADYIIQTIFLDGYKKIVSWEFPFSFLKATGGSPIVNDWRRTASLAILFGALAVLIARFFILKRRTHHG